jgi:hypothetical protein
MTNRIVSAKGSPYAQLLSDHVSRSDELPIDSRISRLPAIKRQRKDMLAVEARVQRRAPDKKAFIRYADLRSRLADALAVAYFDAASYAE